MLSVVRHKCLFVSGLVAALAGGAVILKEVMGERTVSYDVVVFPGKKMSVNGQEFSEHCAFSISPNEYLNRYSLVFRTQGAVSVKDFCFAQWAFAGKGLCDGRLILSNRSSIAVSPRSPDFTTPGMRWRDYSYVHYLIETGRYSVRKRIGRGDPQELASVGDKAEFLKLVENTYSRTNEVQVYITSSFCVSFHEIELLLMKLQGLGCEVCFLSAY